MLAGTKTTTCCLYLELELDEEEPPTVGSREVAVDSDGRPVGDSLTGLANRMLLQERLEELLSNADRDVRAQAQLRQDNGTSSAAAREG
jgi:hypothetical protein